MAATWDSVLGAGKANDIGLQLAVWGVLYNFVAAVMQPVTTVVGEEVWRAFVEHAGSRALTPPELAMFVVRGWMTEDAAANEAEKSGINAAQFHLMVSAGRNPIAPQEAAVALRRQIIPEDDVPANPSYMNAIRQGNTGEQWAPVLQALATAIPSPADVLQGALQGQTPPSLDPKHLYEVCGGLVWDEKNGIDWYDFMFNTRGSAPTPMEALEMVNRQLMPWGDGNHNDGLIEGPGAISYHQAFLEGPWRNKWEPIFEGLAEYLPPPRSVVAMLHNGSITPAQATTWLTKAGLAPETVQAYVHDATRTKTATHKEINAGSINQMLVDKVIDVPTAVTMYQKLGYDTAEATLLATTAQARQTVADLNAAVNRVRTYYIAHKINRATAQSELGQLGLPPDRVAALLAGWDVARASNVRTLTAAQIENAWEYGLMTEAEALQELQVLGYTALDAWILLSIKAKAPLPNKPAGPPALTP